MHWKIYPYFLGKTKNWQVITHYFDSNILLSSWISPRNIQLKYFELNSSSEFDHFDCQNYFFYRLVWPNFLTQNIKSAEENVGRVIIEYKRRFLCRWRYYICIWGSNILHYSVISFSFCYGIISSYRLVSCVGF